MRRTLVPLGPMHVERVHLGPRRVMTGNVQRIEIVPVILDLRPFGHRKAHIGENRRDLFCHLADGVDRAKAAGAAR